MSRRAQVIVQTAPDAPHDWRWFVACLCFIQFYYQSVTSGTNLWLGWSFSKHEPWDGATYFWFVDCAFEFAGGIAFLGLGRCLWQQRATVAYWLIRVVGLFAASLLVELADTWVQSAHDSSISPRRLFGVGIELSSSVATALACVGLRAPWLLLLLGILRMRQSLNRRPRWRFHSSVLPASAWAAGQIATVLLFASDLYFLRWARGSSINVLLEFAPEAYILLALGVVFGLYIRNRWVIIVTGGLVLFEVIVTVCFLRSSYLAFGSGLLGYLAILNLNMFFVGCVYSVKMIGPWVLMTVLVWRVLICALPDDGSPFPRSFCGHCRYNLHGLDHPERCPECGSALD